MDGTTNFKKDLEKLDKKIRNKLIKTAQKNALKPLASAINAVAPVGKTERLKKGIKPRAGRRKKNWIITVVLIQTPNELAYAGRSEFGTRNEPARPFIRPTVKIRRAQVVKDMISGLEKGLKSI